MKIRIPYEDYKEEDTVESFKIPKELEILIPTWGYTSYLKTFIVFAHEREADFNFGKQTKTLDGLKTSEDVDKCDFPFMEKEENEDVILYEMDLSKRK